MRILKSRLNEFEKRKKADVCLFENSIKSIIPKPYEMKNDKWNLADKDGNTVAHAAAFYHQLPANFSQWEISNKSGWSVAHTAAKNGSLPKDFSQWDIATNTGWTVAHVAAQHGNLPAGFDQWFLCNNYDVSVKAVSEKCWGF